MLYIYIYIYIYSQTLISAVQIQLLNYRMINTPMLDTDCWHLIYYHEISKESLILAVDTALLNNPRINYRVNEQMCKRVLSVRLLFRILHTWHPVTADFQRRNGSKVKRQPSGLCKQRCGLKCVMWSPPKLGQRRTNTVINKTLSDEPTPKSSLSR